MRSMLIVVLMSVLSGCATAGYQSDPAAMDAATRIFTNWMNQDHQQQKQTQCYQNSWKDYNGQIHSDMVCR